MGDKQPGENGRRVKGRGSVRYDPKGWADEEDSATRTAAGNGESDTPAGGASWSGGEEPSAREERPAEAEHKSRLKGRGERKYQTESWSEDEDEDERKPSRDATIPAVNGGTAGSDGTGPSELAARSAPTEQTRFKGRGARKYQPEIRPADEDDLDGKGNRDATASAVEPAAAEQTRRFKGRGSRKYQPDRLSEHGDQVERERNRDASPSAVDLGPATSEGSRPREPEAQPAATQHGRRLKGRGSRKYKPEDATAGATRADEPVNAAERTTTAKKEPAPETQTGVKTRQLISDKVLEFAAARDSTVQELQVLLPAAERVLEVVPKRTFLGVFRTSAECRKAHAEVYEGFTTRWLADAKQESVDAWKKHRAGDPMRRETTDLVARRMILHSLNLSSQARPGPPADSAAGPKPRTAASAEAHSERSRPQGQRRHQHRPSERAMGASWRKKPSGDAPDP